MEAKDLSQIIKQVLAKDDKVPDRRAFDDIVTEVAQNAGIEQTPELRSTVANHILSEMGVTDNSI